MGAASSAPRRRSPRWRSGPTTGSGPTSGPKIKPTTMLVAAEWVLPISSGPIRDGIVAVEGSRIAWVGPRRELPSRFLGTGVRAFPRSVLLPGWVNAHCHLNLTAALGTLTGAADRFPDWIR